MTIYSFLRLLFAPNTDLLQLLGSDARVLLSPLLLIGTSLFVLFAVAGAVIALRDRDATASVLLLVLAYFALVSSGPEVWYYPRFRAPLIVPMATLAAIAMFALMENVRKRRLIGHAE